MTLVYWAAAFLTTLWIAWALQTALQAHRALREARGIALALGVMTELRRRGRVGHRAKQRRSWLGGDGAVIERALLELD